MNKVQELELKAFLEANLVESTSTNSFTINPKLAGVTMDIEYLSSDDSVLKRIVDAESNDVLPLNALAVVFAVLAVTGVDVPALYREALEKLATSLNTATPEGINVPGEFYSEFFPYTVI